MKPSPFAYERPATVDDAVGLLREQDGMAKLMAGGQSLVPMLNLRLAPTMMVIDISRIAELKRSEQRAAEVEFGACTTHAAIEDGLVPDASAGLMARVAAGIAYRAIRNRGTIGGSMALADPAAEWPIVLAALDARIVARGPAGEREIAARAFVQGPYFTALRDDEIVTAIRVPKLPPDGRTAFHKVCRKTGEYASSLAVAVLDGPAAAVVLGATGKPPVKLDRLTDAARAMTEWADGAERALVAAAERDFDSAGLLLAGYERRLHATTAVRAARGAIRQ